LAGILQPLKYFVACEEHVLFLRIEKSFHGSILSAEEILRMALLEGKFLPVSMLAIKPGERFAR